jgi:hypothetical protein
MFGFRSQFDRAPRMLVAVLGMLMLAGALLPVADHVGAATSPSGQITVRYKVCPKGFNTATATAQQLNATCTGTGAGVKFDIRSGSGNGLVNSATTGSQGKITFLKLGTATYSAREYIPSGFAKPRVFCRVRTSETGSLSAPFERSAFQFDGKQATFGPLTISHTAGFGTQWDCNFYNIPL